MTQSFSENWSLADHFTLEQAAFLWCEQEPKQIYLLRNIRPGTPSEVAAVFSALHNEAQVGTLPVTGGLQSLGDYSSSVVSRIELEKFAKAKKQYPAFLFDTIAPSDQAQDQEAQIPTAAHRRGRKRTHDWDSCVGEIVRLADLDGLPEKQSELMAHLKKWFSERYDAEPAQSDLYMRVSPIWTYVQAEKAKSNKA